MAAQDTTATEDAAADAAFLASQAETPAEEPEAPAVADDSAETVADSADKFLAAKQDVAAAEQAAWDEAIALMKAAKQADDGEEAPAATADEPIIPAPAEAIKADPPPAPKTPEVTPEAAKLFDRLTQAEIQLREMSAKVRETEQRAARVAKLEAAIEAANNGDATQLFRDHLRWTPETVAKYAEQGPEALRPTVTDNKLAALQTEIAELKQQQARREAEATLNSYKSSLAQEISKRATDYQWLTRNHTDPESNAFDKHAAASEICDYQGQMLISKGITLTFDEAAAALNASYEKVAKRFIPAGASKAAPVTNSPVAPKPAATAPKVTKPPRAISADPDVDPDWAAAVAVIRQQRAAR